MLPECEFFVGSAVCTIPTVTAAAQDAVSEIGNRYNLYGIHSGPCNKFTACVRTTHVMLLLPLAVSTAICWCRHNCWCHLFSVDNMASPNPERVRDLWNRQRSEQFPDVHNNCTVCACCDDSAAASSAQPPVRLVDLSRPAPVACWHSERLPVPRQSPPRQSQ